MQTNTLPTPPTAPVQAGRWALIDQTCQIMFVGDGPNNVVFVFPTSTGLPQYRDAGPERLTGVPLRPGQRQQRVARQLAVPGGVGQPAQREHVQAAVLRQRPGDPRRQHRADLAGEPRVRPPAA